MFIERLTHNSVYSGTNVAWMKHGCLLDILYDVFALQNFQPIDNYTILTQVMISLVLNWLFYPAFSQNMQEKNLISNIK